jgi:AraC-like DNA-binding protein
LFIVGMARVLNYYGGSDGVPRRVAFDYPAPAYSAEYSRILGASVVFDRSEISLEFAALLLDVPQVQWNARIYEAVEQEAERALSQREQDKPHTSRVRQHLEASSPALPDMKQAARQLGMAARSLRRRLAEEGVTFQELLVEARVNGALRLLRNPECSVKHAAYVMGFAGPGSFHRAFKRWTGMSPSEARRRAAASRRFEFVPAGSIHRGLLPEGREPGWIHRDAATVPASLTGGVREGEDSSGVFNQAEGRGRSVDVAPTGKRRDALHRRRRFR